MVHMMALSGSRLDNVMLNGTVDKIMNFKDMERSGHVLTGVLFQYLAEETEKKHKIVNQNNRCPTCD
jgi:hypothetical protein